MYRQANFFHQSNDDPAEKCWRKVNTLLWHHSYSQKYIQLSVTYDWRASIASCRWTCMTTSFRPIRRIKPLVIGTKSSFFVACHGLGFGLKAVCSAPRLHCYCSLYCSDQPQYATIADKTLVNSKRIQTAFGRKMRFCSLYLQSNASLESLIPSGGLCESEPASQFPMTASLQARQQGPTEIWTRIAGFRVQSANHYTMEPQDCGHSLWSWPKPDCETWLYLLLDTMCFLTFSDAYHSIQRSILFTRFKNWLLTQIFDAKRGQLLFTKSHPSNTGLMGETLQNLPWWPCWAMSTWGKHAIVPSLLPP